MFFNHFFNNGKTVIKPSSFFTVAFVSLGVSATFTIAINLNQSPFTQILHFSYYFFIKLVDLACTIRFKHLKSEKSNFFGEPDFLTDFHEIAAADLRRTLRRCVIALRARVFEHGIQLIYGHTLQQSGGRRNTKRDFMSKTLM